MGKDSLLVTKEKYPNYKLLKLVLTLNDVKLLNLILKNIVLNFETMELLSEYIFECNYDFKYLKLILKYSKDDFGAYYKKSVWKKYINSDNYLNALKYLAKINKKININNIFLSQIYSDKYISIFEFLIKCGANVNYNKEDFMPLEIASFTKSYNIFNLLIANGALIYNCSINYCKLYENYELLKFFIYNNYLIKPPPTFFGSNNLNIEKNISVTCIIKSKYFPIFKLFFDTFNPNDYYDDILRKKMSKIHEQYLIERGFKYKYCELCNEIIEKTKLNYNFVKNCLCLVCKYCNEKIKKEIEGIVNIKIFKCLVCLENPLDQIKNTKICISCYECRKLFFINTNDLYIRKIKNKLICDDCAEYKMTCPKCKVECLRNTNKSIFVRCWNCKIKLCYFCERVAKFCGHFFDLRHDVSACYDLKKFRLPKRLILDSKNIEYNKFENESDNSDYLSDISYFSDEYDDFCL